MSEFIIVVVGVLVALAADSAMERRRERAAALDALSALQRDIAQDLGALDTFWAPQLEAQRASRDRLERFLKTRDPILDSVQFVRDVRQTSNYFTFDANTSAIEDLKNSGGLHLIEDEQLRGAVLTYLNDVENIVEFDQINRAGFLELSGRLGPEIVGGLALSQSFEVDYLNVDSGPFRSAAATALDAPAIRGSDDLRRLLIATSTPFFVKESRYLALSESARDLLSILAEAIGISDSTQVDSDSDSLTDPRIRFPDGSGGVNQAEHVNAPYVVLISLDGFRYDYMDLFETPNLHRISDAGVRSAGLLPIYPVKTFPNHYSIATGMYAETHGLVGNRFYEPEFDAYYAIADRSEVENGRWYGGEPIWVTAETQGMVSASYFWVGTEAPVMGVQPTDWYPFDNLVRYENRVDSVIQWLDRPATSRPHVITLYFEETDNFGHNFPTNSPEMRGAVQRVDGLIGRLLDGIDGLEHGDQVNVVVVSDHGMGAYLAEQTYFLPDLLELGDDVDVVEAGPHMIMYVDGDDERKEQLRDALAAVLPNVTVYRVRDMPERLHYSSAGARLGDLALVPDFGWSVLPRSESERPARSGWTHGWDRNTPQMRGLFVASGPSIAASGMVPEVENVHIYPLLAEILGLDPNPQIDGRLDALRDIIR